MLDDLRCVSDHSLGEYAAGADAGTERGGSLEQASGDASGGEPAAVQ